MGSWYIKQLFRRGQYTGKKNENEKRYIYIYIYIKLVAGKTSLYLIDSFCTPHSLGFNRSFWLGSFVPICCYPFPTDNHSGNFGMENTARNKEI